MKTYDLIEGGSLEKLKELSSESVHCVVTSPPYWQLRDYFADEQIGLEKDPQDYINHLTTIFFELKRVLRKDGVFWLVIGDTYSTSNTKLGKRKEPFGLKNKNLLGIPWRLAFSLQEIGWYLRCDCVQNKTNAFPDGAKDRPTRCIDYVFQFTKSSKYFYDYYAILEDSSYERSSPTGFGAKYQEGTFRNDQDRIYEDTGKRNKRSVWNVPARTYKDPTNKHSGHFAVFPQKLVEPCILSSTSAYGCCISCEKPWSRKVGKKKIPYNNPEGYVIDLVSEGWTRQCACETEKVKECIVLDPFCGTSTTGAVALQLGRSYMGIDINKKYLKISEHRLYEIDPIFSNIRRKSR